MHNPMTNELIPEESMRIAKMVVGLVLLMTGIAVVSTVPAAATSTSSAHISSTSSGTPDGMPYN
jgi:hypothetical protein